MKTYDLEELLIKLTEDTIKDVVEQYRDRLNDGDVGKLIELGIALELAKFVPDKWTKIDIETYEMGFDLNTLVQFTDDNGDTATAVHNEADVLMAYPEQQGTFDTVDWSPELFQVCRQDLLDQIHTPVKLGISSRGCGEKPENVGFDEISWLSTTPLASAIDNCGTSGWTEEKTLTIEDIEEAVEKISAIMQPEPRSWTEQAAVAFGAAMGYDSFKSAYEPQFVTEDYAFPQNGEGRGSRVETLSGGQGLGELFDVEYFHNKVARGIGISTDVMAGYNAPYELEYKCEFTPKDLDELSDLINKVPSEEMKF